MQGPLEGPLLVDQVHPAALQDLLEAQTDILGQLACAGVEVGELVVEFVEAVDAVLDQFDPGSVVERVDRGADAGGQGSPAWIRPISTHSQYRCFIPPISSVKRTISFAFFAD